MTPNFSTQLKISTTSLKNLNSKISYLKLIFTTPNFFPRICLDWINVINLNNFLTSSRDWVRRTFGKRTYSQEPSGLVQASPAAPRRTTHSAACWPRKSHRRCLRVGREHQGRPRQVPADHHGASIAALPAAQQIKSAARVCPELLCHHHHRPVRHGVTRDNRSWLLHSVPLAQTGEGAPTVRQNL